MEYINNKDHEIITDTTNITDTETSPIAGKVNPKLLNEMEMWLDNAREAFPYHKTDVGQAQVFSKNYKSTLCYSKAFGWMHYDGVKWHPDSLAAHAAAQNLTKCQLNICHEAYNAAQVVYMDAKSCGDSASEKQAESVMKTAQELTKFAIKCQSSSRISATLKEAQPMLSVRPE